MTEKEMDRHVDPGTGQATQVMKTERVSMGRAEPDEREQRSRRIRDYLRAALAMEDPLAANVAAVNSDLMFFGHALQQAIAQAMEITPTALEEFGKLMPAIDAYMRISRQVERFSRLNQQLAAAEQARQQAKQTPMGDPNQAESEETGI